MFSISGVAILIVIPLTFVLAVYYFTFPDFSSQYGITTISVDGKQLYFKREARGLNHDDVILSPNNDHCAEYNPETDVSFPLLDDIIYYKIKDDVLYLVTRQVIRAENFPVKVEFKSIYATEGFELSEKHKEMGLELLDVRLRDELKCD